MADNQKDIVLKINVRDGQGNFLSGTVDIRLEHTRLESELRELRAVDTSGEITISGLRRGPEGMYKVFVSRTDPWMQKAKLVNIPPSGLATMDFVFETTAGSEIFEKGLAVRGTVRHANGVAAAGFQVRAFDRDLRSENLLGEVPTDRLGTYRIAYSANQVLQRESGSADLVVKAFAADGKLLATSPILFNAPPEAEIDLTIPLDRSVPPSLFERIAAAIGPLLGDVKLEELEENQKHEDLTFLAGETGFDKELLARFILSHRLVWLGLAPEPWFALLGGSFLEYSESQSLEANLASVQKRLPSLDAFAVGKAFQRAFAQQEIPAALVGKRDEWIAAFLELIARQVVSEAAEPSFLKAALDHAGITSPDRQAKLARLFNQHRALTPGLLAELEKDDSFDPAEVADLRTSCGLAELTQGDFSVVKMLKEELNVRRPEEIPALAKRSEGEWSELIERKHRAGEINIPFGLGEPAGTVELPQAQIYAATLERQFREAFPTVAFAGGLERALDNGGVRGMKHAEPLRELLNRHPDLDLLRTPVDELVKAQPTGAADDEAFRLELGAVQRVFKLAPTFEATDALLADGQHSAQSLYRLGESEVVRRYADRPGFSRDGARSAWKRAAATHAAALTVIGDLAALDPERLPDALKNSTEPASFASWENLFQSGDVCHCEHCRSVLSPAAYFTDLLMFLRDRNAEPGEGSSKVKDVLFKRRPDLGYLELNCENALTTLPYVDLVCEVLERVVADGKNDVELAGFSAIPAGAADAKAAVAAALSHNHVKVGADFTLSQVDPEDPGRWVVHGDEATYLLKKETASFFAEVLPNTKAGSEELRAYPAYVNSKAYAELKKARFPLGLPFDLFAEEVRAAFRKSNLQRWDLMRTLRGSTAPDNPTEAEIAAEYFGISRDEDADFDEMRLIFVAEPTDAGQRVVWGEAGNPSWPSSLENVKTFLRKSGLEYKELLALLDLPFINEGRDLVIEHLDSSCDTDKKVLHGLKADKLDRIHRFLRLWRKLGGWQMWELDLAIRRIGGGEMDERFLVNLFYFSEVRTKLGGRTTVEQALALFYELNTETSFTKLHEKRADGLYQKLFLNRKLIKPLDPAFQLDPGTGDLPAGEKMTAHHPVVLAALGIRESDLDLLKNLKKAPGDSTYVTDDGLTLANLSFLWRHAWLARLLKFKMEDWAVALKILSRNVPVFASLAEAQDHLETKYHIKAANLTQAQVDEILKKIAYRDVSVFACPRSVYDFLETIHHVKASGFTPDELNWLLAADRSAKAATKEADAARFLVALRKDLQAIQAENDPEQYDFLTVSPPTDVEGSTALLTSLLRKLNRNEEEISFFLKTLRGGVLLEAGVQGLPESFTFPESITGAPNHIPIHYDVPNKRLRFTGLMTDGQRGVLLTVATGEPRYRNAIEDLAQQSQQAVDDYVTVTAETKAASEVTLPGDRPSIPIRYDAASQTLSFVGLMTREERDALKAIPGNPIDQIEELYDRPRLAVKLYEIVFTASLQALPPAIDFKVQLPSALSLKISYDPEQRLLRFAGIMSNTERKTLDDLVPSSEIEYHSAIESLATQPRTITSPDERVWLDSGDLDATPASNDTVAKRLANAARKGLAYLSKTFMANAVVQQASAQLGLTEALTRRLLSHFAVLPPAEAGSPKGTLLAELTGPFIETSCPIPDARLKDTLDGWFWANRVAAIWKKWKMALPELERILGLSVNARLLDFLALPLDSTGATASLESFLRTGRLLRMRDSLPERAITLLEVLEKLNAGAYTSFATDVEGLNDAWHAADVNELVDKLDLAYPGDYLLTESWERLRRAFYFIDNLNAGAAVVKTFAAATMDETHAKTLKELLRSKLGTETWLTLSAEIQDALRERKRDALTAYLLTQPKPDDAPTGKWENTNDLYAYYLLDVEMSACQLTSRLVQASGSVQLFVQRCLMGLEPSVKVVADGDDGDSAWRWWKWMRKYRVWEANRKVFLWPENWIEPELKKDRSQFFKDFERDLLQNEVNAATVETAFASYLEKLDGVARLEVAGFYQEDDADETILHVFGRTETEPHAYYYRRFDYRQWTPWEKVDLDIQGDYLVPAVVNKRLFLFWPVFTEVPAEAENTSVSTPVANQDNVQLRPAKKKLRLQMAVSDYRQGKWTPKRVSRQYAESEASFEGEIVRKHYSFFPVDRSEIDRRFGVRFDGYSVDGSGNIRAALSGAFEIAGCKGAPVLDHLPGSFHHALRPETEATGEKTAFLRWEELQPGTREDYPQDDFTLENSTFGLAEALGLRPVPLLSQMLSLIPVLSQTPDIFKMSPPWHLSYLDRFWLGLPKLLGGERESLPTGTWLPLFYSDKKRSFFILPSLWTGWQADPAAKTGSSALYYPDIKREARKSEGFIQAQLRKKWADKIDLTTLQARPQVEEYLAQQLPGAEAPPFSDDELRELMVRFAMGFVRYFLGILSLLLFQFRHFHFRNFYHPFVCDFAKLVYDPLQGIPGLMKRETQLKNSGFNFGRSYGPTFWVVDPSVEDPNLPEWSVTPGYPKEVVDFSPEGASSPYNWELFFHAPLLVANLLSRNQRFEEARDWYHFIFNPIGVESPIEGGSATSKYWITKPFFETTDPQYVRQRIENLLRMLSEQKSGPGQPLTELEKQVIDWRTNPFEPHRIANYRTVAYQKTVVMKYLDNLIAWGDYLFRQDSMESINEATQLYILAAEILGPRPKRIPPQAKPPLESFNELEKQLDKFANALVRVENLIPPLPAAEDYGPESAPLPTLYFCIPHNEKMLGYWDTVADRLYKIRHCMNIEGVVRQLALFEPPIDPGALVKAVAAGLDISAALADLNAPLPLYRFNVLLQKANEVCNDVKALGGALLSALEKKDAEALSLLRQSQELRVLEAVKAVREKQIDEAKETLESLRRSWKTVEERRNYYRDIEKVSSGEAASMLLHGAAIISEVVATVLNATAGTAHLVPTIIIGTSGFGGSPHVTVEYGGGNVGSSAFNWAAFFSGLGGTLHSGANLMATQAGNERRWDDWKLQERLADKELLQIDKQIAAAELRVALAEKELENHVLQIENAKAVDAFMRSKYTNEELYQWQVGQISGVYFQSYKLAYDLAKRAERCFRFELGLKDSSFIQFGYWDSLKKGLLSGEKLQYDLRRLESAYLEQNRRELELTKHVSLLQLDPLALVRLRETGRCFFRLPEELFDLDYPGHYFRRIKSVSLTLPCITGPYTTVSCTLRLLKSSVRINTATNGDNGYPRNTDDQGLPAEDTRFVENSIPVKAIAASNAQNDSGMFELSFRDERYLPFEGAGALSEWSLELFNDLPANNPDPGNPDFGRPLRQFDYGSISDAVLHVRYTAREDAGVFKNSAIKHLREFLSEDEARPSLLALDLRRDFPTQWNRFVHPADPADENVFELEMSSRLFPMRDAGRTLRISTFSLLARCTDAESIGVTLTPPLPVPPEGANTMTLTRNDTYGGLHFGQEDVSAASVEIAPTDPPATWRIKITRPGGGNLEDLILILGYKG